MRHASTEILERRVTDRSTKAGGLALVLAIVAAPASTQTHRLVTFTVAGGGGTVVGASHVLRGTAGQPAAGTTVASTTHRLTAGFWPGASNSAPTADLSLTKTDDATTLVPGQAVIYTLVVANAGPAEVAGARVVDTLPAELLGATWTCDASPGASCAPSGVGSLDESVDLAANASATFRLTATVDPTATGSLLNTASVSAPVGVTDPDPTNDAATDTDVLLPTADLRITKQDGRSETEPGSDVVYTIRVLNAGPSHAPGVLVSDALPPELASCSWSCDPIGGATCGAPPSGDLDDTATLPPGTEVVYTGSCLVAPSAGGLLENTATVDAPSVSDPVPGNNSATDVTTVVPDLWIFTDGFESGDPFAWSSASPPALLVTEVEAADHYLARLSLDPTLLRRVGRRGETGEEIVAGLDPDGRRLFSVRLRRHSGRLELGVRVDTDDERALDLSWRPIHFDPRELEVEWRRSLPGLADGALFVAVDGDLAHWWADLGNHRQELHAIGTSQDRGRRLLLPSQRR